MEQGAPIIPSEFDFLKAKILQSVASWVASKVASNASHRLMAAGLRCSHF